MPTVYLIIGAHARPSEQYTRDTRYFEISETLMIKCNHHRLQTLPQAADIRKVAMPIIEAVDLSKTFRQAVRKPGLRGALQHLITQQYRDVAAVDRINLRVQAGESLAYLGPNGAGKSTTIKMLTGILV